MPIAIWYALGAAGLLTSFGYAADKTGEGVESASNGAIKLAVAAGVAFIVAKKLKVI